MHHHPSSAATMLKIASIYLFLITITTKLPKATSAPQQRYTLIRKTRLSHDSCLLRFALPSTETRTLGNDPTLPTCIKITLPAGTGADAATNTEKDVSKSYSPISHPSAKDYFELVVKSYDFQPGGGMGAFLCGLQVHDEVSPVEDANESNYDPVVDANSNANVSAGESDDRTLKETCNTNTFSSILGKLKSPRMVHGGPSILNRWKHVGLIAGGTGIAPLFQIARILLESGAESEDAARTTVHLLYINRQQEDILIKDAIDELVREHPDRFFVTYSLTRPDYQSESTSIEQCKQSAVACNSEFKLGRGSSNMALDALPPPADGDGSTMVFICGKDGFVESWGGAIGRAPDQPDGTKGIKIQGPLLGWLAQAGYRASEVFKY